MKRKKGRKRKKQFNARSKHLTDQKTFQEQMLQSEKQRMEQLTKQQADQKKQQAEMSLSMQAQSGRKSVRVTGEKDINFHWFCVVL